MPNSPPDQASLDTAAETDLTIRADRASRLGWPFGVVGAVVVANLLPLLGIVDTNPLGPVARIALLKQGFLPGKPFTDNYVGYTSQALGHLAALDWLHGIVPWWNPFEGLGVPLLAEMQSAAFFPPTLLLALPQGQLYFHMALELIAGLATWFLIRELGFNRPIATLGGILFALNGTFAWLPAAPGNPVAFLPVMILGIERLYRRRNFDSAGFLLLAGGLALTIYAGFPETAYFEGLFAFIWFIFRFAGSPCGGRVRFFGRTALGGLVGLMLAAPIVVAFLGYLSVGYIGPNLRGYTRVSLWLPGVTTVGLPYLLGPIKAFYAGFPLSSAWVEVGGFVTAPVLALAFVGFVGGRRERVMRWLLAGTAAVLLLWTFGVPFVKVVLERVLLGVHDVEYFRFAVPVWELAFVLLACFGVERIASGDRRGRGLVMMGGALFALGVMAGDLALLWKTIGALEDFPAYRAYPVWMLAWGVGIVLAVTAAGLLVGRRVPPKHRRRPASARNQRNRAANVVVALLVVDAIVMFVVPELSAPRSVRIDYGPAKYLARHLEDGRFFSIDAYEPNYGSYFELASADVNDVPVPKLWVAYVAAHLARGTKPAFAFGVEYVRSGTKAIVEHLVDQLPAYEAIDVRYVVVPTGLNLFGRRPRFDDGVAVVYRDAQMTIYALPHPEAYFRTMGSHCRLAPAGHDAVTVRCTGPATLVRSGLALPGWSATVNGRNVPIVPVDGGLTSLRLPPGTSQVSFTYLPPHEDDLGIPVFVLGLLLAIGVPLLARRRSWRRVADTGRERADIRG